MNSEDERTGPRPGSRPVNTTAMSLADVERSRRRWKLHKRFTVARRISAALDVKLGLEPRGGQVDYDAMGFTLGMPERRAAGLALLERERAA